MSSTEPDRINSFVIQKQHLTEKTKGVNAVEVVRDVGGLHATSPTTPYLSLFERMRKFDRDDLERELYQKRTLGKVRYVRTTVYILPRDFIPTAFAATGKMSQPKSNAYSKFLGISDKQYRETSDRIVELLERHGGRTVKSIREALGTKLNVSPIVNLMCDQGLLIRGPPEKSWKSNLHTYHLMNAYFPDVKLDSVSEAEAMRIVVKEYISSFGPASEVDISWWTGFTKSEVREAIDSLKNEVAYVQESITSKTYCVMSEQIKSLTSVRPTGKVAINLLPGLDPYLMGYKERDRYLSPKNTDYVFDRSGNATSTVLLNGMVTGVWDVCEIPSPLVKLFLFEGVRDNVLEDIRAEAKRLGKFIMGKEVSVRECDSMTPLTRRKAGGVLSPLRES